MAHKPSSQKQPRGRRETLVGQVLVDRYTVLERQGSGGMSIVYRARHELLNKIVAIKVLRETLAGNPEAQTRFHREARAAASIDDPHIVDITDYGFTDSGEALIVMEHLEGRSLREVLRQEGALEPGRCVAIMRQILKGLASAHAQGVIHRDLKSDNVFLLQREGKDFVKLLDFGISKVLRPAGEEGDETGLTFTGVVMGTPHYIAPEQAHGVERADLRADLYSAGVIFYEMLTGQLPFTGGSPLEIMMKQIQQRPVSPRQLRPDLPIPEVLEQVVLKAMRKERDQRHATALEMLQALPDPVSLPGGYASGALPAAPLPRRRAVGLWAALGLGLALLVGGGGLLLHLRGQAPAETRAAAAPAGPDLSLLPADSAAPAAPDAGPREVGARITIRLRVEPASARISLDGRELGQGQVQHQAPRGSSPLVFLLRAPGYQPQELRLIPDRDQSHELRLNPRRRAPPRRGGTPMGVKQNPYR